MSVMDEDVEVFILARGACRTKERVFTSMMYVQ